MLLNNRSSTATIACLKTSFKWSDQAERANAAAACGGLLVSEERTSHRPDGVFAVGRAGFRKANEPVENFLTGSFSFSWLANYAALEIGDS
jgi:hypothetical protein